MTYYSVCACDYISDQCDNNCCCDQKCTFQSKCTTPYNSGFRIPKCNQLKASVRALQGGMFVIGQIIKNILCIQRINVQPAFNFRPFQDITQQAQNILQNILTPLPSEESPKKIKIYGVRNDGRCGIIQLQYWQKLQSRLCYSQNLNITVDSITNLYTKNKSDILNQSIADTSSQIPLFINQRIIIKDNQVQKVELQIILGDSTPQQQLFIHQWNSSGNSSSDITPISSSEGYTQLQPIQFKSQDQKLNFPPLVYFKDHNTGKCDQSKLFPLFLRFKENKLIKCIGSFSSKFLSKDKLSMAKIPDAQISNDANWISMTNQSIDSHVQIIITYSRIGTTMAKEYKIVNLEYKNLQTKSKNSVIFFSFKQIQNNLQTQLGDPPSINTRLPKAVLYPFYQQK